MDPTLQLKLKAAIEKAVSQGLLTEELRQKLVAAAESGLTPEQLAAALEALKKADEQYTSAKALYDDKVQEINEKHLTNLKRVVPKVMAQVEEKERAAEDETAKNLLSNLD